VISETQPDRRSEFKSPRLNLGIGKNELLTNDVGIPAYTVLLTAGTVILSRIADRTPAQLWWAKPQGYFRFHL
jgi:hypothetical protein